MQRCMIPTHKKPSAVRVFLSMWRPCVSKRRTAPCERPQKDASDRFGIRSHAKRYGHVGIPQGLLLVPLPLLRFPGFRILLSVFFSLISALRLPKREEVERRLLESFSFLYDSVFVILSRHLSPPAAFSIAVGKRTGRSGGLYRLRGFLFPTFPPTTVARLVLLFPALGSLLLLATSFLVCLFFLSPVLILPVLFCKMVALDIFPPICSLRSPFCLHPQLRSCTTKWRYLDACAVLFS